MNRNGYPAGEVRRRLAGLLTEATQSGVALCYERARGGTPGHYRVVWTGGPAEHEMRELTGRYAHLVPDLDIADLRWDNSSASPQLAPVSVA